MAVARVLHVVHVEAAEHVRVVIHDLEALLQRGRLALDISAADQENLIRWRLNVGEVVLELLLDVHLAAEDLLGRQLVLVDVLRVALQNVDRAQRFGGSGGVVCGLDQGFGGGSGRCDAGNHGGSTLEGGKAIEGVFGVAVEAALTALLVADVLVVEPVAVALLAVDPEDGLEQLGHYSVCLLHLDLLVALGAGKVFVLLVTFTDVALLGGKLSEAFVTGTRMALGTLEDSGQHHHADRALEVLGLDSQARVGEEVLLADSVFSASCRA